jgi:hypothetical protein
VIQALFRKSFPCVRQPTVQAKYLIYREYQAVKNHPVSGANSSVYRVMQGLKNSFFIDVLTVTQRNNHDNQTQSVEKFSTRSRCHRFPGYREQPGRCCQR